MFTLTDVSCEHWEANTGAGCECACLLRRGCAFLERWGYGIPIALFGSWGYVLISHLNPSPILLTTTYLLYSSILSFAGTAQARLTKWRYPVLSLAGHGVGCYAALLSLTRPSVGGISWWWLAEFLVPVLVVVLYILADWSLAKGGKRPSTPNLSTGPPTPHHP